MVGSLTVDSFRTLIVVLSRSLELANLIVNILENQVCLLLLLLHRQILAQVIEILLFLEPGSDPLP